MDKNVAKFTLVNLAIIATNATMAAITRNYAKKTNREGKTVVSGILNGLSVTSAVLVGASAKRLLSAASPSCVIVFKGKN